MALQRKPVDLTHTVVLVAAGLLFLSFGHTEMAGSDMWWHIAAGRELVQTGTLWMVDDWSFSAHGKDWLNHEWLSDLVYYGWESAWGVHSLVYWKWLVIVATFSSLLAVLYRSSGSPLAALVCTGFAVATAAPFLDVRPHLYTLLFYTLLLNLIDLKGVRTNLKDLKGVNLKGVRPLYLVLLALFFVLWTNLHGGFFFGLMALGIVLFPWRDLTVPNFRAALLVGVVCALACMLNPSGAKIFLYPLTYAFDETSPYRGLAEWLSPFKRGGITSPLFFYLMWMPAVGLLYALPAVRRRLDVPWEGIALTGLTLAMALTSRRFIPLFGISLAVMVAPLLGLGLRWLRVEKASLVLAFLALLYALFRLLPYPMQSGPAFHYLTAEYDFPVETLNFIEANNISGNTYAFYNWGGYIHWRTDGALKVFIDGRADTIYDGETYNQYLTVLGTRPGWLELMEANGTDYILWPHFRGDGQQKLRELVATGRWRAVYSDAVSWLLARKDTVPETEMLPSPPGPWRDIAIARISDWSGNADNAIEYAEKVREAMPWHKDACGLLIASFRSRGEPARADEILFDCRTYFPTRYLR